MSFTCLRCGATSHHPKDEEHGYCGRCHDFTANADRLDRVDLSLARQLSRSMTKNAQLHARNAALVDDLQKIVAWSEAYPLSVFPEPDFKKAAELLQAGGMTLDAISASNMRHVVEGVGRIAREALARTDPARGDRPDGSGS